MNIIIPMAGLGSRFPESIYGTCKPLIPINGSPMIEHAVKSLNLEGEYIFILRKDRNSQILVQALKALNKDCEIIILNDLTQGPAETCLAAKHLLGKDEELVVANSDQIMWWNSELFISAARSKSLEGLIVTYDSDSPANSYARIDGQGNVTEIREKEVFSKIALNGIHYWKKAEYFISSVESMMKNEEKSNGEYYVGPSFNHLINQGYRIGIHHLPSFQHNPVGIPSDLQAYKEKLWKCTE